MSPSSPDETPPPAELQGLDPKDLLHAGLGTVPPVTLPPQPIDSDATVPAARPQPTQPAAQVELPLPEELTKLLPGGNYHVESFLGQGGMGAVYKGIQVRLKRPVAIKIMRRDMGKDYDFEARFEREAQAMAKLNHPNIVSVIDFGEAGPDYLYIVMELIDGADLMDVIRGGQMTQEMALSLLPQICDALQFAHDHGIVHRDIKPSNIMLTRDGRVKMCDFGLAKRYDVQSSFRTQTGTGMGTPDYAAPEQFDPKANIDHRADIYALGVMIYQMITGQLPRGVWKPPSQRASIAPQWDSIVSRAMQSDPSDRYQQASEMKTDVSSIPLAGKEGSAGTPARNPSTGGAAAKKEEAVKSDRAPVKSRAPLLIGVIGGIAVIAISAFFAFKKSDQGGATAPPAVSDSATKTPSTEPWQDVLRDPTKLQLADGAERTADGLQLPAKSTSRVQGTCKDAAIRIRSIFDPRNRAIANARSSSPGNYSLIANDEKTIRLYFWGGPAMGSTTLQTFPVPRPLQPGQEYELELRAVGSTLTARLDGQLLGSVEDSRLSSGAFGVNNSAQQSDAPPLVVRSVEFLDLDQPAAVSPSPSLPVSKSPDPKFPPGQWVKLFTKPEDLPADVRKPDSGVKWEDGVLEAAAPFSQRSPLRIKNGGIMFKTPLDAKFQLRLRDKTGDEFYALNSNGSVSRAARVNGSLKLDELTKPPSLLAAKFLIQWEFFAIGNRLIAKRDGTIIATTLDTNIADGNPSIANAIGTFRDIEVINLDGLPEAEALRLLGVDEKGNDVRGVVDATSATASAVSIFAGHRYQFVPEKLRTWSEARDKAEALGGHLAIVESKAELDWLVATFAQGMEIGRGHWLGGFAKNAASGWKWLDSTPIDRSLWLPGQPDVGRAEGSAYPGAVLLNRIGSVVGLDDGTAEGPLTAGFLVEWDSGESFPNASLKTATATKEAPFTNSLGMKFVPVPITGGPTDKQRVLFSIWETRVQDYEAFRTETKRGWKKPDMDLQAAHPVVNVSWEDARAFCAWLTDKEHTAGKLDPSLIYRLPSDHEWSCAMGIGDKEDPALPAGKKNGTLGGAYPWGTSYPPMQPSGNYADEDFIQEARKKASGQNAKWVEGYKDGFPHSATVGSFPPNSLGLHDLGGNVWEWCLDKYEETKDERVLRGGSWRAYGIGGLLSSSRYPLSSGGCGDGHGFRVVLAPTSVAP